MATARKVVVDDTDDRIHYSGQDWFQDRGTIDNMGNFGPTYRHTSHGTNSHGSLSFSFQGTSIALVGTVHPANVDSGTSDWECFVDQVSIGTTKPIIYPENNWILCEQHGLVDCPHTISANGTTAGGTFWVDYLVFIPSPQASFDECVLLVQQTDPAIKFDSGWQELGTTAKITTVKGSKAKFDFIGKSVTWIGYIPTELPHSLASGSFSIDGGESVPFELDGLPAFNTTVYNQAFFTTQELEPGPHSLEVTYNGADGPATPLTLDYLYVTNTSTHPFLASPVVSSSHQTGAAPVTSTSVGIGMPPPSSTTYTAITYHNTTLTSSAVVSMAPSPSVGTNDSHQNLSTPVPVGAIVGGVVGGVSLIALVLCAILCRRRRERARTTESRLGLIGNGSSRPSDELTLSTITNSSAFLTSSTSQLYDASNTSANPSLLYIPLHSDRNSTSSEHSSHVFAPVIPI